jgi:hypothetical protein
MKNSSVTAEDSRFLNNIGSENGGKGAAVFIDLGSSASVFSANRCRFTANISAEGSAVFNKGRSLVLTNCLLNSNYAYPNERSAPLHMTDATSTSQITNCTIADNTGHRGGAAYLEWGASLTITNSIFWENLAASQFGNTMRSLGADSGATVYATYTLFNDPYGLSGAGNIFSNPFFVDADGADNLLGTDDDDYRLGLNSPGLDSGLNQSGRDFSLDLALSARLVDLPWVANTGGIFGNGFIDRGCYERSIPACPADFDESGFVDSDDFVMYVSHFALGCTGPGEGAMGAEPACVKSADFDQSGFVDSDDFVAFNTAFETPCNP